jgi:predicted SAM-dependent methyltransferase
MAEMHLEGVKKASMLRGQRHLRLHVGCGLNLKSGWVNIDLVAGADLQLDAREPLPLDDGAASVLYTEHFFEHLNFPSATSFWDSVEGTDDPSEALSFLRECKRVVEPGGIVSIAVPDGAQALRAYVNCDPEYLRMCSEVWHPLWCDTPMHSMNFTFRQGDEHRYAWDAETLLKVLADVGFVDCRERPFDPDLDKEERRIGTLYVEAKVPGIGLLTACRFAALGARVSICGRRVDVLESATAKIVEAARDHPFRRRRRWATAWQRRRGRR